MEIVQERKGNGELIQLCSNFKKLKEKANNSHNLKMKAH